MKTKHIVTKTSTHADITPGEAVADNWAAINIKTSEDPSCVVLSTAGFAFDAPALRDMAKLFKKLADALDRPEVL